MTGMTDARSVCLAFRLMAKLIIIGAGNVTFCVEIVTERTSTYYRKYFYMVKTVEMKTMHGAYLAHWIPLCRWWMSRCQGVILLNMPLTAAITASWNFWFPRRRVSRCLSSRLLCSFVYWCFIGAFAGTSETSLNCRATWHNIPEDRRLELYTMSSAACTHT